MIVRTGITDTNIRFEDSFLLSGMEVGSAPRQRVWREGRAHGQLRELLFLELGALAHRADKRESHPECRLRRLNL